MQTWQDKNLGKLKEILLHDERQQLATLEDEVGRLKQTIEDKEALIESLEPVVADLLSRKIHNSREEMAAALAPVMGEAIRQQIIDAKEDVVDALYPVIGQTIRKSVAEAMKRLVDSINEKLDRALRQRFFSRKIKSKISGVSEGELLLKESLPFRIEEIFLIHKESGLLLSHVSAPNAAANVNEDLISGMLTAIRSFSSDIFKTEAPEEVHEIQYDDHKIKVAAGRNYYLALVITGIEPENLPNDIWNLERQIHNRFHKILREFHGDPTSLTGIQQPIKKFITKANKPQQTTQKPGQMLAWVGVFLLIFVVLVWALIQVPEYLVQQKLQKQVYQQLEAFPQLAHQPFSFELEKEVLTVSGYVATPGAKQAVDSVLQLINGVRTVENHVYLKLPVAERERAVRQKLVQFSRQPGVSPKTVIEDDLIYLTGEVPSVSVSREISLELSTIPGVRVVMNEMTVNSSVVNLTDELQLFLRNHVIFFGLNESGLSPENQAILNQVAEHLQQYSGWRLVIKGFSDNQADSTYNLNISRKRAESVATYLQQKLPSDQLVLEFFGVKFPRSLQDTPEGRAENRRVEFEVSFQ